MNDFEQNVTRRQYDAPAQPLTDPAGWRSSELAKSTEWQYRLTANDVDELSFTLAHVNARGLDLIKMRSTQDFPLNRLADTLKTIGKEVHHGRGFVLLRGIPVDNFSREEIAAIYWGMGLYLGYPVSQNAKGQMLGHVVDLGHKSEQVPVNGDQKKHLFNHTEIRGYNTREGFHFHTGSADIVGLLCLHPAKEGGESIIVSSVTIHNEIFKRRPDLLSVLYQPYWVNRQRELPAGAKPYFQMSIFNQHKGKFLAHYTRAYIESCRIFPELPPLSAEQLDAFALIEELTADPNNYLSMTLEKGDIQYLNNHVTLHTRTAYQDFPEPERKRHLLRLWLVSPEARALPHWHYDASGAGRRAGIYVPGMTEVASLEP